MGEKIEQCNCELDGFQGAVSSHKCKIHKEPSEDFEQMSSEELWDKAYQKGKDDKTAEVKKLIEKELFIAHTEGTPTSRLTSLYNKV